MKKYSESEAPAAASRWLVALGRPDAGGRVEEARDELEFGEPVQVATGDMQ